MLIYVILALVLALIIWFMQLGFKIFLGAKQGKLPKNTTVMVLGSKVHDDGNVSKSLKRRLDVAYAYLTENQTANVVLTGGKGHDEPISEALAQKNYLINLGIDEKRMIIEDKSTTTRENMKFALPLVFDKTIIIATQDFHMYRSLKLAKDTGYKAFALPAKTDKLPFVACFFRELLALTKYYLEKILLRK